MRALVIALIAGLGVSCVGPATQGAWPLEPSERTDHVTAVVRNDLGQLKWVATEATDYTPLEAAGRRVYLRGGCFFCHSQYVRPVSESSRPWGR